MLKPCVWTDTDIDAVYFKIHRATNKSCELKKTNKKKTTFNLSHKNHNSVMNPKRDEIDPDADETAGRVFLSRV